MINSHLEKKNNMAKSNVYADKVTVYPELPILSTSRPTTSSVGRLQDAINHGIRYGVEVHVEPGAYLLDAPIYVWGPCKFASTTPPGASRYHTTLFCDGNIMDNNTVGFVNFCPTASSVAYNCVGGFFGNFWLKQFGTRKTGGKNFAVMVQSDVAGVYRPGEMTFSSLLIDSENCPWESGFKVVGPATAPGSVGIRRLRLDQVRVADAEQASFDLTRVVHFNATALQVDPGEATNIGSFILAESQNVSVQGVFNCHMNIATSKGVSIYGSQIYGNTNVDGVSTGTFSGCGFVKNKPIVDLSSRFYNQANNYYV